MEKLNISIIGVPLDLGQSRRGWIWDRVQFVMRALSED